MRSAVALARSARAASRQANLLSIAGLLSGFYPPPGGWPKRTAALATGFLHITAGAGTAHLNLVCIRSCAAIALCDRLPRAVLHI